MESVIRTIPFNFLLAVLVVLLARIARILASLRSVAGLPPGIIRPAPLGEHPVPGETAGSVERIVLRSLPPLLPDPSAQRKEVASVICINGYGDFLELLNGSASSK